ncbi:MAG: hypothetical protein QG650_971 [Patescibacteria group bacterium]|nr:hypothetical protein [Patescibacteria group bacterium]
MKTSEIEHEERHWSEIFRKEKNKPNFRTFSSYWWKTYYGEIVSCSSGFLPKDGKGRVLELGSGSGKSSILISDRAEKVTLLDISPSALEYARFLAEKFGARNVETVQGDAFDAPFDSSAFDFVWNIGVLEHYSMPQIRQYLSEMARLVKS